MKIWVFWLWSNSCKCMS